MKLDNFNKLWLGQTISLLGSAVTTFALPTLAIFTLHATPLEIGTLSALAVLPFPVLGMLVGVLADRLARRKILITADIVRFAALASIPIAAHFGVLRMGQLYVVALFAGIGSAFFGITYQSYLPLLVRTERLIGANTKLEFSNSGSQIAGSAIAGALVQWLGAAFAIAVDAVSYLASIVSLVLIRTEEEPHNGPSLTLKQAILEVREGIACVFDSHDLRWILGATATTNLGGAMIGSMSLLYAYRVLHLQPGVLGVVFGFAGLGFIGALLSARVRETFGLRLTLIISLVVAACAFAAMLLASLGFPYVVLFISSAIAAIAVPIYNINQVSYRQALVDQRLQGRMNATMRTFVWGVGPLGSIIGGYLGNVAGIEQTIAAGAVVAAAGALWLLPMQERAPVARAAEA